MNLCVFLSPKTNPNADTELLFKPALKWMEDAFRALDASVHFLEHTENFTQKTLLSSVQKFETGSFFFAPEILPLLQKEDLENSYRQHLQTKSSVTVLTAKEAASAYWIDGKTLTGLLTQYEANSYSAQQLVALLNKSAAPKEIYPISDPNTVIALNSAEHFTQLHHLAQQITAEYWQKKGVYIFDPSQVWISPDAEIGKETLLLPGTIIQGKSRVGSRCTIGPQSLISDSEIGDRTIINATQVYQSRIDPDVTIGPFCHIRPNSVIHHHVKIGDFVEVKNSEVGAGTAISHLTYIGDSDVGKNVNFGCGVVTVNYDGVHKHRCTIGDGAFIGCNTNLVAPVSVGKDGYTGAGSTITQDVPDYALGIERTAQVNKPDFSKKKLKGRKKKV